MAKSKYPSDLNTKHIRVDSVDYDSLAEIGQRVGFVTMAETLHIVLEVYRRQEGNKVVDEMFSKDDVDEKLEGQKTHATRLKSELENLNEELKKVEEEIKRTELEDRPERRA
jgi:hypothetical protein